MNSNGFHRACNPTVRRFFEDFDLLPRHLKEMLWDSPRAPTFDDIKAAWELSEKTMTLDGLLKLNVFEDERKAELKRLADLKREQKKKEKNDRYWKNRKRDKYVQVYQRTVVQEDPKQARLVARVSEQRALELMSKRVEAKDLKPAGPVVVNKFIGWKKVEETQDMVKEEDIKVIPKQHICKMLHNA